MRLQLPIAATVLLSATAVAEPGAVLEGRIVLRDPGPGGKLIPREDQSGSVVYIDGYDAPPVPDAKVQEMAQNGKAFVPSVVAITAGEQVSFPNDDNIMHNVFLPDFSTDGKCKDLGQYRSGSKTLKFEKAGLFHTYCNIHVQMAGWVVVLRNPAHAVTDASGKFRIAGIRPGKWNVVAWNPRAVPAQKIMDFPSVPAPLHVELPLDATVPLAEHKNKWGGPYSNVKW